MLKKKEIVEKKETVASFLDSIWDRFDTTSKGSLGAKELQVLLQYFSKIEISPEDCNLFLSQIDTNGDSEINKAELSNFIAHGCHMSAAQREEYAGRGKFQSTIVAFFEGFDREVANMIAPEKTPDNGVTNTDNTVEMTKQNT